MLIFGVLRVLRKLSSAFSTFTKLMRRSSENNINNSIKFQKSGVLHHEKIFKNYNVSRQVNPWFCGLANTVINSYDYFNQSDRRLFNKFNTTRDLADFSKVFSKKPVKIFPSEKLDCGWIDYPNLEYPNKVMGVGLRRIQGFKSNCPYGSKKPFRLESLPESIQLSGKCIPLKMKLKRKKDQFHPGLPKWVGIRPDISLDPKITKKKLKRRPIPHELDCWIHIPYTIDFFNSTRNFEIGNFLIFQLLKPHKKSLSEGLYSFAKYSIIHDFRLVKRNCSCPSCIKATKARTIIDATTNWLGFTNKEIGAEKLVEIISVFTGNKQYQEYYSIDDASKAIIVKQVPIEENIIIGINGEQVSHTLKDLAILSEIQSKTPFSSNPEYNREGREVVYVAPSCDVYVPLSWDEQLAMDNIKILYGHGKDIQRTSEMYQPATVATLDEAFNPRKYLPSNPEYSERSILEVRDWFSFCKLTRSLIRSTPHFTQLIDKESFNMKKLMLKRHASDVLVEAGGKIR